MNILTKIFGPDVSLLRKQQPTEAAAAAAVQPNYKCIKHEMWFTRKSEAFRMALSLGGALPRPVLSLSWASICTTAELQVPVQAPQRSMRTAIVGMNWDVTRQHPPGLVCWTGWDWPSVPVMPSTHSRWSWTREWNLLFTRVGSLSRRQRLSVTICEHMWLEVFHRKLYWL